jgi:hypothetical protein
MAMTGKNRIMIYGPLKAIRLSASTPLARHYLAGLRRDLLKLARQTKTITW